MEPILLTHKCVCHMINVDSLGAGLWVEPVTVMGTGTDIIAINVTPLCGYALQL